MTKISLAILAAGVGSRYGGIKQMDSFGPGGAAIIDYSLYDAWKAGFSKVVFIIKKEIEADFKALFHDHWKDKLELHYVYQEKDIAMEGIDEMPPRSKPWGTGHAMVVAASAINEPFAIINADDFYGREPFIGIAQFLKNEVSESLYAMAGYNLGETLSENGSVSRGVCWQNGEGMLQKIVECKSLLRKDNRIVQEEDGQILEVFDEHTIVSMNFWGFHQSVLQHAHHGFNQFVMANINETSKEYFIPLVVSQQIEANNANVKVIPCGKKWFGVTYKEDKNMVVDSLNKLVADGEYPVSLWD